jgi:hypothetical protein
VHPVKQKAPPPGLTIAQEDGVMLQLKPSEDKSTCGSDQWNIPRFIDHRTEISAIIATVPDPIHSHLALDFDRSIDAILLAAADNQYLSSSYWIPWRSQTSISSSGESTVATTMPTAEDNARELQPGLIILRYAPDANDGNKKDFAWENYNRVIYLFLVAETPALGINGNQLQRAFFYESQLKKRYNATLYIPPRSPEADVPVGKAPNAAEKQKSPTANRQPDAPHKQRRTTEAQRQQEDEIKGRNSRAHNCQEMDPEKHRLSIIGPFYSGSASSLHAGIIAALPELHESCASITGVTGTTVASQELDPENEGIYRSFGENTAFEQHRFLQSITAAGYKLNQVAVLSEAGTVYGSNSSKEGTHPEGGSAAQKFRPDDIDRTGDDGILYLRFPRELSLLRNAEANQSSKANPNVPPTPYLNLSLKDYSADDTVPRFSTNQSPLSIEAQLMAIAHQLQLARSEFILISASNVLDDLFLAQFLHRACPDARLVILSGGDLLFERDGENSGYVGSISISPYLLSSLSVGSSMQWLHADFQAEAIYNAASFTFWNSASNAPPSLAGYRSYPIPNKKIPFPPVQFEQIPLWATVIGADRYYPLAVLSWCGSDRSAILPTIFREGGKPLVLKQCADANVDIPNKGAPDPRNAGNGVPESINENSGISPSLLWGILAAFISLACIAHCTFLLFADFWSPFTCDLAIGQNDLPCRRAVYVNIGTAVLTATAFVAAYPLIRLHHYFPVSRSSLIFAWSSLGFALCTCICTSVKTWRYSHPPQRHLYTFFNLLAAGALLAIIGLWIAICCSDNLGGYHSYAGLYFSYRCLQPLSGVCPLFPVILVLLAWYLWAIYSTARLRFSHIHRPRLARLTRSSFSYLPSGSAYPLFVPDDALESCTDSSNNCLYENITCLLISREVICRFCSRLKSSSAGRLAKLTDGIQQHIDLILGFIYATLLVVCVFASHVYSLDHFLLRTIPAVCGPTSYEILLAALFFPLIMVALSSWLRVIFIWGAINRGLLEPLERMPIRFAFSRYKGGSWMSMLRQKGLYIRWRDMGRSTESIRQLIHHPDLAGKQQLQQTLSDEYEIINARIHELVETIAAGSQKPSVTAVPNALLAAVLKRAKKIEGLCPSECLWDLPKEHADLCSIFHIEEGYARFCSILIEDFLSSYWDKERTGLVEQASLPNEDDKSKGTKPSEPSFIQLAEELIVVRYVALIRAVLINIRYLMLFVSAAFVLALIAWNSYPFEPHALIDWCFTILLAVLSLGLIWVFAQMHRNAILSRITNTTANELGWEFYLRIATFGAVPVLTWLAYQFPEIGGALYKIIQPGLEVAK